MVAVLDTNHFRELQQGSAAAEAITQLRAAFPRIGTMDLKIAAICEAHDAMLLTRNLADFRAMPKLVVENWLD
tara:strand:+ start:164 stop:382 length:219 start_codon:yes stop_codon:yes gene_type:complete